MTAYLIHLDLTHDEDGSYSCSVRVTPGRPMRGPHLYGWDPPEPGDYEVVGPVYWHGRTTNDGEALPDLELNDLQAPESFWRCLEQAWEGGKMSNHEREGYDE